MRVSYMLAVCIDCVRRRLMKGHSQFELLLVVFKSSRDTCAPLHANHMFVYISRVKKKRTPLFAHIKLLTFL